MAEELAHAVCEAFSHSEYANHRTLIVASGDLSRYYHVESAEEMGGVVIRDLEEFDHKKVYDDIISKRSEACGYGPIRATMMTSKKLGATSCNILSHGSSGDTSGDYGSVVRYVSAAFSKM